MSKLAKYKGGLSKAAKAAQMMGKGEKIGKAGHEVIKLGTHAVLALASKNLDQVGPIPVKPDVLGGIAGAGMMMFGKGKTKALGKSILTGAAHAIITRYVATDRITFLSGGEDKSSPAPVKVEDAEVVDQAA